MVIDVLTANLKSTSSIAIMSDRRGSIFLRAAAAFFQRIMTPPLATSAAFRTTTYSNLKVEFINSVSISDLTKI